MKESWTESSCGNLIRYTPFEKERNVNRSDEQMNFLLKSYLIIPLVQEEYYEGDMDMTVPVRTVLENDQSVHREGFNISVPLVLTLNFLYDIRDNIYGRNMNMTPPVETILENSFIKLDEDRS